MVQQKDKEKLRQLSMEFISLKTDEKEQKDSKAQKLKADAQYQELLTQKKQIMEQIKAREEEIADEELKELAVISSNQKLIKEDMKQTLEVEATVVTDILKYRKAIHDKPDNDLLEKVSTAYVELYQLD